MNRPCLVAGVMTRSNPINIAPPSASDHGISVFLRTRREIEAHQMSDRGLPPPTVGIPHCSLSPSVPNHSSSQRQVCLRIQPSYRRLRGIWASLCSCVTSSALDCFSGGCSFGWIGCRNASNWIQNPARSLDFDVGVDAAEEARRMKCWPIFHQKKTRLSG